MAWVLVPNLVEFRSQINEVAPNRDHASDGSIGDYEHSQGSSSHNPDDTGKNNSEWDGDPDSKQEVRAFDCDVDFRQEGITAPRLVSHLIKYAKNGTFWWIRYVIYNRVIYRRNNDFKAEHYSGTNPHDKHIHINSEYTQKADDVKNVNYRLEELLPGGFMADITQAEFNTLFLNAIQSDSIHNNLRAKTWQYPAVTGESALFRFNQTYELVKALAGVIANESTNAAELQNALASIPTAQETAEAVVESLGGVDTDTLVATLKSVLTEDQIADLKAAL